jgi:hypothetical protein
VDKTVKARTTYTMLDERRESGDNRHLKNEACGEFLRLSSVLRDWFGLWMSRIGLDVKDWFGIEKDAIRRKFIVFT